MNANTREHTRILVPAQNPTANTHLRASSDHLLTRKSWIPNICCFLMRINLYLCDGCVGVVCTEMVESGTYSIRHTFVCIMCIHIPRLYVQRQWDTQFGAPHNCDEWYPEELFVRSATPHSYFQYDLKVCCSNGAKQRLHADRQQAAAPQTRTQHNTIILVTGCVERMGFHRNDDFYNEKFLFFRGFCF